MSSCKPEWEVRKKNIGNQLNWKQSTRKQKGIVGNQLEINIAFVSDAKNFNNISFQIFSCSKS